MIIGWIQRIDIRETILGRLTGEPKQRQLQRCLLLNVGIYQNGSQGGQVWEKTWKGGI